MVTVFSWLADAFYIDHDQFSFPFRFYGNQNLEYRLRMQLKLQIAIKITTAIKLTT